MSETQQQTSAPATSTTPAAPPPEAGKSKGKATTKAAKAPAAPTDAAPAKPAAAPAAPPSEHRPEITVAGQRAVAEATEAAQKAADEASAGKTKSKSLDQVKAERRAREAAKGTDGKPDMDAGAAAVKPAPTGASTPAEKPADKPAEKADDEKKDDAKADKPKSDTVEVDVPQAKLTEFTKLNRDLTSARKELGTAKGRIAELEPDAATMTKARKLAAEGKHWDAIKAAGLDFDAASMEVLRLQAEEKDTDPKVKELADKLAETQSKLDKLLGDQTKDKETRDADAAALAKANRAVYEKRIIAEVKAVPDRFPYLSRDASFVREALDGADEAYPLAVKVVGRPLTDEEKNNLLRSALEEAEERHAARAVLYGTAIKKEPEKPADKKPADKPAGTTPTTADAAMRGGIGGVTPRGKVTYEEMRARRKAAALAEKVK